MQYDLPQLLAFVADVGAHCFARVLGRFRRTPLQVFDPSRR